MTGLTGRPFVLLDDSLSRDGRCRLFRNPERIIRCDDPLTAGDCLDAMDDAVRDGFHVAGFAAYELGYLLEPALTPLFQLQSGQPLLWFGVFREEEELPPTVLEAAPAELGQSSSIDARPSRSRESYLADFERVKDYIAAGDVYQVNLTFKHLFYYDGDPLVLYRALRRRQPVRHGAMISADDFHLLSFSPEMFLRVGRREVEMRPMKGTIARGRTPEEDDAFAQFLRNDEKSRAENLMILDLMRNDLGRVAEIGSVSVTDMYSVERFRTLHQMTSGVRARLRDGVGTRELLRNVFPCGSVTGAPKIRAMQIIRELEETPRGAYTGSIGVFGPDGAVDLNVAIRTLFLSRDGAGEMGIGSGIVQDSDGPAEFKECLLKGNFLTTEGEAFRLIETMRWSRDDGYWLLDEHVERLAKSARYFDFPCDETTVRSVLAQKVTGLEEPLHRVRLTLDSEGQVAITSMPLDAPGADTVLRYAIAGTPTDSADRFLFHKTTRRQIYDGTRQRLAAKTGCDEVLFTNEEGALTEGSFTNLFVERDGRLLTPPLECGLLDGILRRYLISGDEWTVEETTLYPADLDTADCVYLGNSVRGLLRAVPAVRPSENCLENSVIAVT